MYRKVLVGLTLASMFSLLPRGAGAEEPSSDGAPADTESAKTAPIPRVELLILGNPPNAEALGTEVLSWFRDGTERAPLGHAPTLDVAAALAPAAVPGVRVWIFIAAPTTARLLFAVHERSGEKPRFLVDDVALDSGLDEVGREHLAQVVYLSAGALWAGNAESSEREVERRLADSWKGAAPERPRAPPPETPPDTRSTRFTTFGVEYRLGDHGSEGLAQAIGVSDAVPLLRGETAFGAQIRLDFVLPRSATDSGLTLDLVGGDARVGALLLRRLGGRFWLGAEAGPGLEFIHYVASFADPSVHARGGRLDVRPISYFSLGLRVDLGPIDLNVAGLLTVPLQRTHYDLEDAGRVREVSAPSRVQPGFGVGSSW